MSGDVTTIPEDEWVKLPAAFQLAPAVTDAATRWPLEVRVEARTFLTCGRCHQAILPLSTQGGAYGVRTADVSAQLLAHLQQRHGWTREAPGG